MKGGRVEFAIPKARITLEPERSHVDLHVIWACAALGMLLVGYTWGIYSARTEAPPACRPMALNEGMVAPGGAAACTYLLPSPTPRKGKPT